MKEGRRLWCEAFKGPYKYAAIPSLHDIYDYTDQNTRGTVRSPTVKQVRDLGAKIVTTLRPDEQAAVTHRVQIYVGGSCHSSTSSYMCSLIYTKVVSFANLYHKA